MPKNKEPTKKWMRRKNDRLVFFGVFYLLGNKKVEWKQPKGKQMAESLMSPCMGCPALVPQAVGSSSAIQQTTEKVIPTYTRKYTYSIENPMRNALLPRHSGWHSIRDFLVRNHKIIVEMK